MYFPTLQAFEEHVIEMGITDVRHFAYCTIIYTPFINEQVGTAVIDSDQTKMSEGNIASSVDNVHVFGGVPSSHIVDFGSSVWPAKYSKKKVCARVLLIQGNLLFITVCYMNTLLYAHDE
jgi:hypothetical protein